MMFVCLRVELMQKSAVSFFWYSFSELLLGFDLSSLAALRALSLPCMIWTTPPAPLLRVHYCCLHNSWRSRVFGRKPKFWSRLKILFYNARSTLILSRNWMKLVPLESQKAQLSAHMKIINKFRVSEIVEKSVLPRHQPLSFERSLLDHLPP